MLAIPYGYSSENFFGNLQGVSAFLLEIIENKVIKIILGCNKLELGKIWVTIHLYIKKCVASICITNYYFTKWFQFFFSSTGSNYYWVTFYSYVSQNCHKRTKRGSNIFIFLTTRYILMRKDGIAFSPNCGTDSRRQPLGTNA